MYCTTFNHICIMFQKRIQDIVSRRADFIGRTATFSPSGGTRPKRAVIKDIEMRGNNVILIKFVGDRGGQFAFLQEQITSLWVQQNAFSICIGNANISTA